MPLACKISILAAVSLAFLARGALADTATPDTVQSALAKMETYVESLIEFDAVPGMSVAVVHKGEVVFLGGFGVREAGKDAPVTEETVFQLASFSKPMSATIVSAIVGQGTVTWDSRIADIDPAFRLSQAYPSGQVTLRDLFAHRSGLPGLAGNELESLGFARDEILHRLRLVAPSSSFRAGYSYSNFGLTEAGVAAAEAAGMSWEEAADTLLFGPLGMTASSYRNADFLKQQNRAVQHVPYHGAWTALATRMPDAQAPAGGASSNVVDLAQWLRLVMGGGELDGKRLIDEAALAETHIPVITNRPTNPFTGVPGFYALGWTVNFGPYGLIWAHSGAFSTGARTVVTILPQHDLGIIVLSNAFPTGAPEAVTDTFFDYVFTGASTRDWLEAWSPIYASMFDPAIAAAQKAYGSPPSDKTPPLPAQAYLGIYSNDYVGEAVVAEQDGELVIRLGPGGARRLPLTHFDRDLFLYTPFDEMPEAPVAVSFRIGPEGRALEVNLEDLDDVGMGTLVRVEE